MKLFAGRPSLPKLRLWADDAEFQDPITNAQGRKQYEPQWVRSVPYHIACLPPLSDVQYGLQAAFSEIERLHHEVTSGGNPIEMDLKTRYVVKGVNKEQTVDSKVMIFYDKTTGKVTKVQDKWNGNLPDSTFKNVSFRQIFSPWWWMHYTEGWLWWVWSFTWELWWWQVRRTAIGRTLLDANAGVYTYSERLLGIPQSQFSNSTEDDICSGQR